MKHRLRSAAKNPVRLACRSLGGLWALQNRERERLRTEIEDMRGLMPLLMKQRNGCRWTESDRRKIRAHLRKLAALSPYMVLFLAPGGFLALPLLAWWLDRRQQQRAVSAHPAKTE